MKKKLFVAIMLIAVAVVSFGVLSASAATEGIYTYSVSEGEVTITDCDTSANGAIVIPNTLGGYPVTVIGRFAFENCDGLTSVTIPDSVTFIDNCAFRYCSGLISVTIPDNVTSIGHRAFYNCTGLTSITIPDSVTSIGDYAFSYCDGLASITIPDSVTTIGRDAFSDCSGLTKVNITDIGAWCNIEFLNVYSNPLYYARNLYLNGNLVTNLEIPDSVTTIGESAFSYCTGLTSITIPDSVTSIGDKAFYNCDGLASITIPDSVTSIGNDVFNNCTGLTSITIPDSITSIGYFTFYNCTGLTSITIPDGVTTIGNSAFRNCTGLTSITIPDSVTTIGNSAFNNCTGLKNITIPDRVTTIGNDVFNNCTGLTNITIPNSVKSIGNYAFSYCAGLTNVTIPDTVTTIGKEAFKYCAKLTSIAIPDSVTSIGSSAFYDCNGLTSVTVGKGLELIPESCFRDCNNLKYIALSENVKSIRNDAFNGCSKIEAVFYEGSESQWNEILFYNRNENLTNAKIVYNATKKTYKFETNCGIALPDVNDYAVFAAPVVKNEGKTLVGWYDNKSLSGEPITFPYYGNTTTLYAAWTDRTGKSFDDAIVVRENKEYTVTITESGQMMYYEFVPKYTGEYRFYSTGSYDTYGYLYNSSRDQITYDDDGAGNNFYISYNLTAGNTYYIAAKLYSGTGTFTLAIETDCVPGTKTVCVTAADGNKIFITIPSYLPENTQVILACYKDGRFTELASAPNKNETIYFIAYEDFDYAKVMAWDSFGNMNPLCEAELVQ